MPLDILILLIILLFSFMTYKKEAYTNTDTKWERETLHELSALKKRYGAPNIISKKDKGCAIWNNADTLPFTKITLNNDKIPVSYYPYPRKAIVEHRVHYEIKTADQLVSLLSLNECLSYDNLRKEIVSVAENEETNIASLAMAARLLNGKISLADAQKLYLKDKGDDLMHQLSNPTVPAPKKPQGQGQGQGQPQSQRQENYENYEDHENYVNGNQNYDGY